MNVLFLMSNFPDIRKNSSLYTDLAEEFRDNGHDVYAVTLNEKSINNETVLQDENGLNVLRIKTGDMFNVGFIKKGITTVTLPMLFKKNIKKYFKGIKFDLIVYATPPITFNSVVEYIKRRDNSKAYLILRDIFPQNAKDLDVITNQILFNYFRMKEKKLYNVADTIGCMSQGNIDFVIKDNNYLDKSKLHLLPNWMKIDISNRNKTKVSYRKQHGLENKFIALYGGNMGVPQDADFILELAKLYVDRDDIKFLFIGRGTEKEKLRNIVKQNNLTNVEIKDSIPREEYESLVRECDIGLISLNRKFTIPNIPSKTLSYLDSAIPMLACTDKNTDYKDILVTEAKAGLWSETGDLETYKNNFEILLNNPKLRKELGKNGRKYLEENLDVKKAYETIMRETK